MDSYIAPSIKLRVYISFFIIHDANKTLTPRRRPYQEISSAR